MKSSEVSIEIESATSNNGQQQQRRGRFLPRFALQRLLYGTPFLQGSSTHRGGSLRSNRSRNQAKTTANAEVQTPPQITIPANMPEPSTSQLSKDPQPPPGMMYIGECPLCLAHLPVQCFPVLSTCEHRSCYDCLQTYLRVEISESRTAIACPQCSDKMHPNDIRMILNDITLYDKYEDFMLRRVLATDPDARWCPQPDCGFAVIASGCASCPKLECLRPGCPGVFCYHCKAEWHSNQTCDAAREQRKNMPVLIETTNTDHPSSTKSSNSSSALSRDSGMKPCPRCSVLIVKMDDGSCNHMTCSVCGAEFCWLCMKEISDLHYLSPSGCTFWGKKPWSRKKKILWQLGTLVGAPVGIALIAGIALPAMIIGIPVWVGRKLHSRYEASNKHKRNLAIIGGVLASILVSPFIAGLVVSIGVPILLFYIYGVVPVSLCRSGGCDVSTSGSGFHFDFDDTTEVHKANPSIGEASLSMDSHLGIDETHQRLVEVRAEVSRDDNASTRALAGSVVEENETIRSTMRHLLPKGSSSIEEHLSDCENN